MSDDSCIRQINGDETKEKEDEGGRKTDNILYSRQRTTTVVRDIPQTWRTQPPLKSSTKCSRSGTCDADNA